LKSLPELASGIILTKARRERFAYWRSVPLRRQLFLMSAAFSLFAAVGLLSSIMATSGPTRLSAGLGWAIVSGLIATLYIAVLTRKPLWMLAIVPLQIAMQLSLVQILHRIDRTGLFPLVAYHRAIQIYALGALGFTAFAYSMFLVFIQTEGRHAFRAQTELALAHTIQQTLVPVIDVVIAGCSIYGISTPSEKVGGDLVDLVGQSDGSAVAYLADIAGHGLQAGILMGMLKTAARTRLLDLPAPQALFERLNEVLPAVKEAHMYATCAALRLRPVPGGGCDVEYSIAGQPPILHISAASRNLLGDEQLPLGLFAGSGYRSQSVRAASGDLFVVATDGILEVTNKQGDEFGLDRLEQIAIANHAATLQEMAQSILAAAKAFGKQEDDQTLLLIRVL
jgi:Stage II sporulation protein E (SpoIIE)